MAIILFVLPLLMLSSVKSEQCNNEPFLPRFKATSHDIMASVLYDGTNAILNCTVLGGDTLSVGQELVWSESGGKEMTQSLVTQSSSVVTIANVTNVDYGEYTCQCYNRQNYTLKVLHKLIHTNSYRHYCSEKTFVKVNPTDNEILTDYHYVNTPGEVVTIVCSTGVLKKVANGSLVTTGTNITVSSPMDQGKYICLNNSMVQEIHYVLIKDYEPVQYLLPTNRIVRNVPFDPDSKTPPPLCVVYSLINLTKFIMEFRSGSFIINIFNSVYSRVDSVNQSVYILELTPNKASMTIEGLSIYCKVTTQWEDSVSSIRYRVKFNLKEKALVPSLCLSASIGQANSKLFPSIICSITNDLKTNSSYYSVTITQYMSNGSSTVYFPSLAREWQYTSVYRMVLPDTVPITEYEGDYSCMVDIEVYSTTLMDNITLYINSITSLEFIPTHDTIITTETTSSVDTTLVTRGSTTNLPSIVVHTSPASPNGLLSDSALVGIPVAVAAIIVAFFTVIVSFFIGYKVLTAIKSKRSESALTMPPPQPLSENPYVL